MRKYQDEGFILAKFHFLSLFAVRSTFGARSVVLGSLLFRMFGSFFFANFGVLGSLLCRILGCVPRVSDRSGAVACVREATWPSTRAQRHDLQIYGHSAQALGFSESLKRVSLRVASCPTSTSSDVSLRDQPGWLWALRVHPRPRRVQGSQVWMRVKLVCFSCLRSQCLCRSALRAMCLVCNPDGF